MKVVKIEEVIRQIGQKGPEVMRSLEVEEIQRAVSKAIAEYNVKNRQESVSKFQIPKLDGLKDKI